MNARERFLSTMLFGTPDRVPLEPGAGRRSTLARWHKEGLPEAIGDYNRYAYERAGGTLPPPECGPGFPVHERMIPAFEEKVIEEKGATRIVQDWKGNICEISSEFSTEYLRNAIDFVTRRWIRCPVETWSDWEDMKRRYDPDDPCRLPEDAMALKQRLAERDYPVEFHFSGPFWQLREWLGFESLCVAFYDRPGLILDMLDFWSEFILTLMRSAFQYVVPDCVHLSEDMAYKNFCMISPSMTRQYLLPVWKKWGECARSAGVPLYAIDSDGFIGELVPVWIEAGVNACDPVEVAAGNDIVALRREFGRHMAFRGGVDKRAMAKGGTVMQEELSRLAPVVRDGGFIPSCDHGVPADVSWPNYCEYVKRLAVITGWL